MRAAGRRIHTDRKAQAMDGSSYEVTFRVIQLNDRNRVGPTTATPELAKQAAAPIDFNSDALLAMERTEWISLPDRMKAHRTIVTEAQTEPGKWPAAVWP